MTLIAIAFALGTASVVAHATEYGRDIRFSKDFAVDYSSARALLDGRDPHAKIKTLVGDYLNPPPEVLEEHIFPGGNWHPPFKIVLTVPFALLPYQVAGVLWLLFSAACFVICGVILGTQLGWSRIASIAAGFAFLAVPITQLDLSGGNFNGPLLLLLLLAWGAIVRQRDRRSGIFLGSVVALKVFPAFLAIPLLGARRFRLVGVAAITTIVLSLAGMSLIGWDHLGSFLESGRGEGGFSYWESSPANISLWAAITRWVTPNGWVAGEVDLGSAGIAIAVAFALVLLVFAIRPRARLCRDPFWAAAPLMLLAWPISWVHYPTLLLPWIVLAGRETLARGGSRLLLGYGLVVLAIATGFPPGTPPLDEVGTIDAATLYSVPTVGLLGAVLLDAFTNRRSDSVTSSSHPTHAP